MPVPPQAPRPPQPSLHNSSSVGPPNVFPTAKAICDHYGDVTHTHAYTNPDTYEVDLYIFRRQTPKGKAFCQAHPTSKGIVLNAPQILLPIYNRSHIRRRDSVVVVEGEKCVEALRGLGFVATTSPGGAGKAHKADWSPLAGKTIFLWPDADPVNAQGKRPGLDHMRNVQGILDQLDPAPSLRWIDPDTLDLPPKGDAADLIDSMTAEGLDRAAQVARIQVILDTAEPLGPAQEVRTLLDDTIAGRRQAIEWPWPLLCQLTKALIPGTITMLCGSPGCGKSLLLLEALAHWYAQGVPCVIYELEEDRTYHLVRALAQRVGDSRLLDDVWIRNNSEAAKGYYQQHATFLDGFGHCIHDPPGDMPTLDDLADWAESMAVKGCRIIAIDPVTIAAVSENRYLDDQAFIGRMKRIVEEHQVSAILVTHPKKNPQGSGMDDLAGGTAYTRFVQTVLWYEQHGDDKQSTVKQVTPWGDTTSTIHTNRSLALRKTRNGRGAGLKLAFEFDPKTLRSKELGVVVKGKTRDK